MSLASLIYISKAVRPMNEDDLMHILKTSRLRNRMLGITGLLLYRDGLFVQVLEGEHKTVDKLFELVVTDSRHTDVIRVYEGRINQRVYGDWSMSFNYVTDSDLLAVPGYTEDNLKDSLSNFYNAPMQAQKLLEVFQERSPAF